MVSKPSRIEPRLDLRAAHVLVADSTPLGLDIIAQILQGFGVAQVQRAGDPEQFRHWLNKKAFDLIIVDSSLGQDEGFHLIRELRVSGPEVNRTAPVVAITGFTPRSLVLLARDCGANFVVVKPLSAAIILERIIWLGRHDRLFVECPSYTGPDRRFRNAGIPAGVTGRRQGDLSPKLGEVAGENLTQDEIDSVLRPQRLEL